MMLKHFRVPLHFIICETNRAIAWTKFRYIDTTVEKIKTANIYSIAWRDSYSWILVQNGLIHVSVWQTQKFKLVGMEITDGIYLPLTIVIELILMLLYHTIELFFCTVTIN